MKWKILGASLFFILNLIQPALARDDFQYWSQYSFKMYDGKFIDLVTFAELRMKEDTTKAGLYFISERLTFDYFKNFQMGLNYTYLNTRKTTIDDDFKFHHRFELEGNPHWSLGERFKVKMRNRMEFRWIEDNGSHNTRYRQQWTLEYPLNKWKTIQSVYISSEFFYDIAKHEYNENRSVPLGMQFKINDKSALKVYYMIQSTKSSQEWGSNHILGTLISFKF
ncbi:MAG: DUF2490 domain-containing protein [Candidatus Omnitrophica bacterium]|nr:DUF2490 domain-containing protein [Candidatus Omnitrophota bacterium]